MLSVFLAYIAGVVTILSPCVLPLLPIILGSALQSHKRGPLYLAAGLVVSFTVFGVLLATIGLSLGLDTELLQKIASSLMIAFGIILIIRPLEAFISRGLSAITSNMNNKMMGIEFKGKSGQFLLGALLGAVWTPCVGPTLGAAISLAAQEAAQASDLAYAALIMFVFSTGTATPVLALSAVAKQAPRSAALKNKMMGLSKWAKPAMGAIFVAVGTIIITGTLTTIEEALLQLMPTGLVQFIYSF